MSVQETLIEKNIATIKSINNSLKNGKTSKNRRRRGQLRLRELILSPIYNQHNSRRQRRSLVLESTSKKVQNCCMSNKVTGT